MQNIGDAIFGYTRPQLERNVDRFLASMPGMSDVPPVSIEVIVERVPDVKRIEVMELLVTNHGVEAMVLAKTFMHRDLIIVVDHEIMSQRDPAPYNMALAEELGHIQLHRAVMLEIHSYEDFSDLQSHPNWNIAERDAKYWGRAVLMPRMLLEPAANVVYKRVANEVGFGDTFKFSALFTAHLSAMFEIPPDDAQKRLSSYTGDM